MKNVLALFVFVLTAALCARPVSADSGRFGVTPKAGYIFPSRNLNLKNNYIYGLGIGYRISGSWLAELDFLTSGKLQTTLEEKGYMHGIGPDAYLPFGGGVNLRSYNANLAYRAAALGRFESFLKFGFGYTEMTGKIMRHERTFDYGAGGVYHYPYKSFKEYHTLNANAGVMLRYRISRIFRIHAAIYDMVMFNDADFGKLETPYHNIILNCGLQAAF